MVNFPTSLDTLANPTSSTYTDDAGYELDVVISALNDIVEALEAKLGTGASTASANTVLRGTGAGTSAFGQVTNADLAGSIAYSKLALTGSLVAADFATLTPSSFTPTWTQSATISKTVNKAEAVVIGKLAFIYIMMTATSAGTASNDMVITLPTSGPDLTMDAVEYRVLGPVIVFDSGTDYKLGQAVATSSTTIKVSRNGGTGYLGSAADAYTVASGDIFSAVLTVRLA